MCKIKTDGEDLGFTIAASKHNPGVFKILDVQPNSSADNAGLKNNDFVFEISGKSVESMKFEDVLELVKTRKKDQNLELLVADSSTAKWYSERNTPISSLRLPRVQFIQVLTKNDINDTNYSQNNTSLTIKCKIFKIFSVNYMLF